MSLAVSKEVTDFPIERAFRGYPEDLDTLIALSEDQYYLRFRRLGGIGIKEFSADLGSEYEIHPPAILVCSATYKVPSQAANNPEMWRQIKPEERFTIYHPLNLDHPTVDSPEELFSWFDKEKLGEPENTPEVTPNIYDIEVLDGLVGKLEFREPADG
jgi:hypothetical protein